MVGSDRRRLTMPPAATAPAPMYRMYAFRMSFGDMLRMSEVPGARGEGRPDPKNLMAEISTRYARTPPPHITDAMRGPMMYPTPSSSGEISADMAPAANGAPNTRSGTS